MPEDTSPAPVAGRLNVYVVGSLGQVDGLLRGCASGRIVADRHGQPGDDPESCPPPGHNQALAQPLRHFRPDDYLALRRTLLDLGQPFEGCAGQQVQALYLGVTHHKAANGADGDGGLE